MFSYRFDNSIDDQIVSNTAPAPFFLPTNRRLPRPRPCSVGGTHGVPYVVINIQAYAMF